MGGGVHISMIIPKIVRQNEVYMSFWTKEEELEVQDFKEK